MQGTEWFKLIWLLLTKLVWRLSSGPPFSKTKGMKIKKLSVFPGGKRELSWLMDYSAQVGRLGKNLAEVYCDVSLIRGTMYLKSGSSCPSSPNGRNSHVLGTVNKVVAVRVFPSPVLSQAHHPKDKRVHLVEIPLSEDMERESFPRHFHVKA